MPTFQRCDESVEQLAREILNQFDTHKPLLEAKARIDFVFAYAAQDANGFPVGDALKHGGTKALGIARILSLKQRALGRGDGEISLDGDWWREAPEAQRRSLLDHELHHLTPKRTSTGRNETDDLGRPKLVMRKHDYQFGWFSIMAMRHGENAMESIQARQILDGAGEFLFPPNVMARLQSKVAAAANPPISPAISHSPTPSNFSIMIGPKEAKVLKETDAALLKSEFDEDEELIQKCIEVIRAEQKASVSLIQRRYRLGYTRAAQIMDELERRKIVGPAKGAEPRDILLDAA